MNLQMAMARSSDRRSERRNFDNHLSFKVHDQACLKSQELVLLDSSWINQVMLYDNGKYRLSLTGNERFDIDYARGTSFSVVVYNHQHYICHIYINRDGVSIDGIYELDQNRVAIHQANAVERRLTGMFKLELAGTGPVYRIDIKYENSVWFGMFIFGRRLLNVRPNGDFYQLGLEELMSVVSRRALENQRITSKISVGVQCMIEARPTASASSVPSSVIQKAEPTTSPKNFQVRVTNLGASGPSVNQNVGERKEPPTKVTKVVSNDNDVVDEPQSIFTPQQMHQMRQMMRQFMTELREMPPTGPNVEVWESARQSALVLTNTPTQEQEDDDDEDQV